MGSRQRFVSFSKALLYHILVYNVWFDWYISLSFWCFGNGMGAMDSHFCISCFLSWLTVHLGFHVLVALTIGISYSEAAAWKGRKKVFFQVTVLRIPGIAVRFYKDGAFHRCFNDGSRLEWFMFAWSGPVERPWTDRVVGWLGGYGPALDELDSWFSSWSPAGFALAAFPVFIWRYRTNCIIPFIWQSVSFNNGRWYGPS